MRHEFVEWPGYYAQQKYCKHCGDWESDASPYRCKAKDEEVPRRVGSVSNLAAREETKEYPYTLSTILDSFVEDELSQINWNGYTAFSTKDDVTVLEFEDGIRKTPNSLYDYGNCRGRLGKKFRVYSIRESWRGKYGLTADE